MNKRQLVGFQSGRPLKDHVGPSPYRIDWKKLRVGQCVHVKMDTKDQALVYRRRRAYKSSSDHFKMKVSCSILEKPGYMTILRLK
jgi:hypothetical protein